MGAGYIRARDGGLWLRDIRVVLGTVCCLFIVSMAQASGAERKMWTDAVMECQKKNSFLPELFLSRSRSVGPLWLMGFEERVNSDGKWFSITYTDVSHKANVKCGGDTKGWETYVEAIHLCIKAGKPLLRVNPYNVSVERAVDNVNSSFWIDTIKPGEFINADGNDVQILCFILTETGEIQTDNCTKRHPFKCVNGNLAPVVVYQGAHGSLFKRYPSGTKTILRGTSNTSRTPTSRGTPLTPTSRGTNNDVSVTTVTKNVTRASTPRSKARASTFPVALLAGIIGGVCALVILGAAGICLKRKFSNHEMSQEKHLDCVIYQNTSK